jgi:hypothetical protein
MSIKIGLDFGGVITDDETNFFVDDYLSIGSRINSFESIKSLIDKFSKENVFIIIKSHKGTTRRVLHWLEQKVFFEVTGFDRKNIYFVPTKYHKKYVCGMLGITHHLDYNDKVLYFLSKEFSDDEKFKYIERELKHENDVKAYKDSVVYYDYNMKKTMIDRSYDDYMIPKEKLFYFTHNKKCNFAFQCVKNWPIFMAQLFKSIDTTAIKSDTGKSSDDYVSDPDTRKSSDDYVSDPDTGKSSDDYVSDPDTKKSSDDYVSDPDTKKSSDEEKNIKDLEKRIKHKLNIMNEKQKAIKKYSDTLSTVSDSLKEVSDSIKKISEISNELSSELSSDSTTDEWKPSPVSSVEILQGGGSDNKKYKIKY